MKLKINEKEVQTACSTLAQLADDLQLPEKGVAVAIDNVMIPRDSWSDTALSEGQQITVIRAACGG